MPLAVERSLDEKMAALRDRLRMIGPCLVAFSAGVDSTLLLKVAVDVLGRDAVLAVTARSASLAADEARAAAQLAQHCAAPHRFVDTDELDDPTYRANRGDRCYVCKRTLFTAMDALARELGARQLLYGAIMDDLADDRPGHRAAREHGVHSPLQEAGLTKAEIRELSHRLGLPTWDKPQMACLASRIPQGTEVTAERLHTIEAAERVVRQAGFRQVRVRHHETMARIEVDPDELPRLQALLDDGGALRAALQALGFHTITSAPYGRPTAHAAPV